ncbi:MAG TPA: sigma 54-interacting transcriptional regulator [Terriglobia bacterium]|nr:sigma 54-interacting transcriptional regulator [Terriglobia bacterium]
MFEKLFESSPDAILVADTQGRIVRVNAQLEKLFGYQRQELQGEPLEVLLPERFRQGHQRHRDDYNAEPRSRPMGTGLELFARRRDGGEFPVDIMLSPVEGESKPLVLAVIRDVTERQRDQEQLRQSEERFRLVVESVKDYAIFMLDPEGRVSSWNLGAERIKGYQASEVLGQHFSRFYTAEDILGSKPEEGLKKATAEGRFEDEGWRVRKDGSRFWANVLITTLRDAQGRLRGFSKVVRDFTDRKRAQEALLLELADAVVTGFDIRRLLAAISASIHALVAHDLAGIALYDPAREVFQRHILPASPEDGEDRDEFSFPVEGSPSGWVFAHREPLVLSRMEDSRFKPEILAPLKLRGIRSACWLPLVHGEKPLGALIVASRSEGAFTENQSRLLAQVSHQVAAALDNAMTFKRISEMRDRLAEEKRYLEDELRTEYNFEEIVGESLPLKRLLQQVVTVAPVDATVLIQGETGTGKELIARAIHNRSPRQGGAFIKVNCAAIPSGLLESELFGHEKGAFTGALMQRVGRMQLADHGTLFLDEVGDIPLEIQPKLLRALQEKEFERLGGTRTIPVDARLIAATNRDLTEMVKLGQFRRDLYYRLRVFPITVPPLRERAGDIPLLVHYFIQKHARRMNKRIEAVAPETMQALTHWRWPGNIRELENLIERAVILTSGKILRVPLSELAEDGGQSSATPVTLEDAERDHIVRVLREARGVISGPNGAAVRLGLKRTTLNFKMRKLGISRNDLWQNTVK